MSDKPIRPFEVESASKARLIGRLLGRAPRAAAFIEIRNILAKTPLENVRQSDIADALAKSKLRCQDVTKELSLIFEQAALLAAQDRVLSDADRRGLATLQRAFELTEAEAGSALENAVGQIFEQSLREALADGSFTDQEKANLEATSKALGMSEEQTKKLYESAALDAVQTAFYTAIEDQRYTRNEEAHVAALAKSLGVVITHDEATTALVARFKLLAQIDDGDLPTGAVPIILKRGEVCHFSGPAIHHRIKTVTKRINYSGPAASIKIMKGVRWRVGSVAVQRIKTDVMTQLDNGTLYVTSTRLFFDGAKKNTSIPFGKITNFTVFRDGLQIEKETGPDEYFMGDSDWELAGACLDGAASKLR